MTPPKKKEKKKIETQREGYNMCMYMCDDAQKKKRKKEKKEQQDKTTGAPRGPVGFWGFGKQDKVH